MNDQVGTDHEESLIAPIHHQRRIAGHRNQALREFVLLRTRAHTVQVADTTRFEVDEHEALLDPIGERNPSVGEFPEPLDLGVAAGTTTQNVVAQAASN